jgi:hypothetical protein
MLDMAPVRPSGVAASPLALYDALSSAFPGQAQPVAVLLRLGSRYPEASLAAADVRGEGTIASCVAAVKGAVVCCCCCPVAPREDDDLGESACDWAFDCRLLGK